MLKLLRVSVLFSLGGLAALSCAPATAQHGGHFAGYYGGRVGVYVGGPVYVPYYYPPPYYYGAPPVTYESPVTSMTYIERSDPQVPPSAPQSSAQPAATAYGYYCPESNAYYPAVKQCPSPWLRALPQTSSNSNSEAPS